MRHPLDPFRHLQSGAFSLRPRFLGSRAPAKGPQSGCVPTPSPGLSVSRAPPKVYVRQEVTQRVSEDLERAGDYKRQTAGNQPIRGSQHRPVTGSGAADPGGACVSDTLLLESR